MKCQASAYTHHFEFVFSSCTETEGVVMQHRHRVCFVLHTGGRQSQVYLTDAIEVIY